MTARRPISRGGRTRGACRTPRRGAARWEGACDGPRGSSGRQSCRCRCCGPGPSRVRRAPPRTREREAAWRRPAPDRWARGGRAGSVRRRTGTRPWSRAAPGPAGRAGPVPPAGGRGWRRPRSRRRDPRARSRRRSWWRHEAAAPLHPTDAPAVPRPPRPSRASRLWPLRPPLPSSPPSLRPSSPPSGPPLPSWPPAPGATRTQCPRRSPRSCHPTPSRLRPSPVGPCRPPRTPPDRTASRVDAGPPVRRRDGAPAWTGTFRGPPRDRRRTPDAPPRR
mmetsp:Transcript_27493/g.55010  ORF Transcript_27493/g.55010 Transcript_27493/m.55010 type:complete len:278 (+) Transcript_27493:2007-2840(+)